MLISAVMRKIGFLVFDHPVHRPWKWSTIQKKFTGSLQQIQRRTPTHPTPVYSVNDRVNEGLYCEEGTPSSDVDGTRCSQQVHAATTSTCGGSWRISKQGDAAMPLWHSHSPTHKPTSLPTTNTTLASSTSNYMVHSVKCSVVIHSRQSIH